MFKDIKFRFIKRKKNIKEFLLSIPKDLNKIRGFYVICVSLFYKVLV